MAVREQTPYIEYVANGSTTSFALGFDCESQEHLNVLVDNEKPEYGAWYLNNNTVVFRVAPKNNQKIIFKRETPLKRETNFQSYDNSFRPTPVNKDFDRIWWKLQELGVADWLLGLKIDKEIQDRIAAGIYYYTLVTKETDEKLDDLKQYIEALVNNITNGDFTPIPDKFITTEDGRNQRQVNTEFRDKLNSLPQENQMWQGSFAVWTMSHALSLDTTQRKQIPVGITHARLGFEKDVTIYHTNGTYSENAMRIQRNATTQSNASHNFVINFSAEESKNLIGNTCCLAFHAFAGDDYAAKSFNVKILSSEELEQPILRDDGMYSNGNIIVKDKDFLIEHRDKSDPYTLVFDLDKNLTQVAVLFTIEFDSGVALVNDYIEVESLQITLSDHFVKTFPLLKNNVLQKASTRYQTTYPYAVPRGSATEQGAISMVSINNNVNYAFIENIRFNPQMLLPPQFMFQSPTSGTESRFLNKNTNSNINGFAFNLNESGVSITNNAVVEAGHRFLCHWTAQVIF